MSNLKELFFESILKWPLLNFKFIGFDFLQQATTPSPWSLVKTNRRVTEKIRKFYFLFNCTSFVLFYALRFLYWVFKPLKLTGFINAAVGTMNGTAILSKVLTIYFYKSTIMKMFETLKGSSYNKFNPKVQYEVTGALRVYKTLEMINIGLISFSHFVNIFIPFANFLRYKKPLPHMIWLPFDPYESIACYFVNVWLVHNFVLVATFFFAGDMTILSMITMITTQYKILKEEIKICVNTSKGSQEFLKLVKRHNEYAELIQMFNEMFSNILFVNVSACLLLCFYAFLATSSNDLADSFTYVGLLQVLMFELYQICHLGQLMSEATAEISEGVYESNWYEESATPFRIGLRIMQIQKPSALKAGQFAELNIATFTSVKLV